MPYSPDDIVKDTTLFASLRLIRSEGVGPVSHRRLVERHQTPEDAVHALSLAFENGKARKAPAPSADIERELDDAAKAGATYLVLGQLDYPANLAAIEDAPPFLAAIGDTGLLEGDGIGIVGARNCSASGMKLTRQIAGRLSEEGFVIVSGLARGIDACAHEVAVNTKTIACLAGGVDVIYPKENTTLYNRIAENGLLLSESPMGCKPLARHFPRRNRIIAGLSKGVLLIEAALKSGSLITARYAAEQGRDVFAVPGSPLDPRAQGCNMLIKNGACLVERAEDLIDELGTFSFLPKPAPSPAASSTNRSAEPANRAEAIHTGPILEYLSPVPIHIDELVRLSGKVAPAVLSELTALEMTGEIERHAGNLFSRSSQAGN